MKKIIAAMTALLALGAQAQEYPSKPISMIVAFPPGGVAELVGRPLAASMEKTLGQPVLIVNRPGAGGAAGRGAVRRLRRQPARAGRHRGHPAESGEALAAPMPATTWLKPAST